MMNRIALWASAGFVVAVLWAFVGSTIGPNYNLGRSIFIAITVPISWIGRRIPLSDYSAVLMNGVAYAIIGLALEPFRFLSRRHR